MSILAYRLVADSVARIFGALIDPTPKPAVRFAEISADTEITTIPTRYGDVEATMYRPPSPRRSPGVYVNVHGGGFVVGHRDQDDPWCRYLAAHAGVTVINTDYVLAPKYRFPAAAEQIYDVLRWASSTQHDWDGHRLCVGGQSAGGNLAAAASRIAWQADAPAIRLQVLHYAPLDLVTPTADKHSPVGGAAVMKPWMGAVFDRAYIPDDQQRSHPLASPAWGSNGDGLAGIAPALIVTAEFDRLRDEADAYARKLGVVGALAEYHEVTGLDHGYNIMSDSPQALEATRRVYQLIADHVVRVISDGMP